MWTEKKHVMYYVDREKTCGQKKKKATCLYKHTCVHVYLGLFPEGDSNTVAVVAIKQA